MRNQSFFWFLKIRVAAPERACTLVGTNNLWSRKQQKLQLFTFISLEHFPLQSLTFFFTVVVCHAELIKTSHWVPAAHCLPPECFLSLLVWAFLNFFYFFFVLLYLVFFQYYSILVLFSFSLICFLLLLCIFSSLVISLSIVFISFLFHLDNFPLAEGYYFPLFIFIRILLLLKLIATTYSKSQFSCSV